MSFFDQTGKMAIGSRLRMLTDKITADAAQMYELYNVGLKPKWFPVFFVLAQGEPRTITSLAKEISHSHPSVSKIIQEMTKAGLVRENPKSTDKRRNHVSLTKKGVALSEKLRVQYADVEAAVESVMAEASHNLWEAIGEWEFLLERKSLLKRVLEQKKMRESQEVRVVAYDKRYQAAFRTLNKEWIAAYFEMEESDRRVLNHPKESILNKGGKIFVALYRDEPVGVCSLIKMNDPKYDFELSKMAVSPKVQGKGIGWLLAQTAMKAAKELGASTLYLESNTVLKAAICLYEKLGFRKVTGRASSYGRSNIQMALDLKRHSPKNAVA